MGDNAASLQDYDQDMQTLRDYVDAVTQKQQALCMAYNAALDTFLATVQTASPDEAKPDVLGVAAKQGLKYVEKSLTKAIEGASGVDLGPMVEMVHAISDESERAAKAATARSAVEFVTGLRVAVINGYTQQAGRQALLGQLQSEYNANDEGGRGGYIGGIQNELAATQTVLAPKVEVIERGLYEGWVAKNFNDDCIDGTGFIYAQFDQDNQTLTSATITAPLGDRIAGRLNNIMVAAEVDGLMSIDVVKKLVLGDNSMCFEGDNVARKDTLDSTAHEFLSSPNTWKLMQLFSTGA